METLRLNDNNLLVEITDRCYTGCVDYCYKKQSVHSRGNHVPKDLIMSRILWGIEHTTADTIYFLGGEPLLHPNFIELCEFVLSYGKCLNIITSGKVSKDKTEQRNLAYVLELYRQGKVYIELSFHYRRNHKEYEYVISEIQKHLDERRKNLKATGLYNEKHYDVTTTSVVTAGYTPATLKDHISTALKYLGWDYDSTYDVCWDYYQNYFVKQNGPLNYNIYSQDSWKGFRASIKFVGEKSITPTPDGVVVYSSDSGTCPATRTEILPTVIKTPDLLIRADGGLIFAHAQCIDMPGPLLNVDIHRTRDEVYGNVSSSIRQIVSHVFIFNRIKAAENCDDMGNELECTACPFSVMCTPCWSTKRSWQ